jgi:hypothetical protein
VVHAPMTDPATSLLVGTIEVDLLRVGAFLDVADHARQDFGGNLLGGRGAGRALHDSLRADCAGAAGRGDVKRHAERLFRAQRRGFQQQLAALATMIAAAPPYAAPVAP